MAVGGVGSHHEPEMPNVVKKTSADTANVGLTEEGALTTLSVRLQGELLEMLCDIARLRQISLSDALSDAITTEHFIRKTLQRGDKILIEESDRKLYRVDL